MFLSFYVLYSMMYLAYADTIQSTIESTVMGHMYLYSVDDMCTTVMRRMAYKGVFISDHSICPEAPIQSDYADTLRELYEYYPLMDKSYVQKPMRAFVDAQHQAFIHCTRAFDMVQYVDELYPVFEFAPCFEAPGTVDAGTYEHEVCQPVKHLYIGNATDLVITSPSLQKCFDSLDFMAEKREKYTDAQLFEANMPGIIAPEMSRVWTTFMPGWLRNHSNHPMF